MIGKSIIAAAVTIATPAFSDSDEKEILISELKDLEPFHVSLTFCSRGCVSIKLNRGDGDKIDSIEIDNFKLTDRLYLSYLDMNSTPVAMIDKNDKIREIRIYFNANNKCISPSPDRDFISINLKSRVRFDPLIWSDCTLRRP